MESEKKSQTPYEWVIGETAGIVWQVLQENGPMSLRRLVQATGRPRDLVMQAVGWLAREDKLSFEKQNRFQLIRLK